ncbi:hypothetical protein HW130_10675 [Streptomyces sp. PKU-EA00015]|uniref:Kelch repeat-containing protein n=1 Tax=Streptomyces sp. PKU-EA00015 TaxID=2748326 RepID=UPI0015A482A9|nr:kelch repeat-containing protein [Streptomyces sp. PKU-EA00015]NWF26733.1 hypothetical protein [Streptomyces sp. PKU-EA00015]
MKILLRHAGGARTGTVGRRPEAGPPAGVPAAPRRLGWRWLLVAALTPLLALTATLANAQDSWETLPDLPTPRRFLAAATAPCPEDIDDLKGTCVYAIGGRGAAGRLSVVEAYSPATNTWQTLPDLPTPRQELAAATAPCPEDIVDGEYETCVYAIGGNGDPSALTAYSPATNTWTELPDLPTPREDLAGAAAPCPEDIDGLKGTCVYAIGGNGPTRSAVEAYSPATNTWQTLPDLPTPRLELAAATAPCPEDIVDGEYETCVYAIGGNGDPSALTAYSPATNTWTELPDLPTPREDLAGAAAPCPEDIDGLKGTCVYAIGGNGPTRSAVEAYSPATNTWQTLPDLPTPRQELAAATAPCPEDIVDGEYETCVYAIGGNGDPSALTAYSPATNTWTELPDLPTPREDLAGAAAPCPEDIDGLKGTCVYAIGGNGPTRSAVEAYSPATNTWQTLPDLPTPRQELAAATAPCPEDIVDGEYETCVYAIGGNGDPSALEAYSPATNTWTELPDLPTPHRELAAAAAPCPKDVVDGKLMDVVDGKKNICVYAIAGRGAPADPPSAVEAYSPATNTWQTLPDLPTPRLELAAATAPCPEDIVDGKKETCVYAIGGGGGEPGDSTALEAYNPATNTWTELPDLPTPHRELAAAAAPCPKDVVDGKLMDVVDGKKNICVYAIAGRGAPADPPSAVEAYSPATNTWQTLPDLPTPRFGLAAATAPCPRDVVDGKAMDVVERRKKTCVYAIGGSNDSNFLGTVEAFVVTKRHQR